MLVDIDPYTGLTEDGEYVLKENVPALYSTEERYKNLVGCLLTWYQASGKSKFTASDKEMFGYIRESYDDLQRHTGGRVIIS